MSDIVVKTPDRIALETVASSFRELMLLKGKQATTQAKLIRWCVMAITQTQEQAQRAIERQKRNDPNLRPYQQVPRFGEASKKVREDRELALLYLQWLATQLENGGSSEEPSELDIRVEAAILGAQ